MRYSLKIFRLIVYSILSIIIPSFFFNNVIKKIKKNKKNVLFLSPFRREKDFEKILINLNYGVFLLDHNYQKKINGLFFCEHEESYFDFVPKINLMKIRVLFYKIYLSNFINFMKKNYNIKIIFNFAIHYKSEVFYDEISTKNEIKFITMHRECLYCNSNIPKIMMKKLKKIPKYKGTKIFVHNDIVKNVFIKSNFCKKDQVAVIGPIRTDNILSFQENKKKK